MEKKIGIKGKARNVDNSSIIFLWLAFLIALTFIEIRLADTAYGAQTTGGVNWLDPLNYQKPAFYPITVPDESTCPNKYYVDMTNGSGSTCSQASPCKALSNVAGKPGMSGGPAYIYLKGNGRLSITSGNFYGSAGNEIVIKPWPGETNLVTMTAGGTVATSNLIQQTASIHHIIMDGGPDLLFQFIGAGSDQNTAYNLVINANYVIIARVRVRCSSGLGPAIGIATNYTSMLTDNTRIINVEVYDCNSSSAGNRYGMYTGGGTTCSSGATAHTNTYIYNSIFRDIAHRGIQVEPRNYSNNVHIEGNAMHNIGKVGCPSSWHCSPAISWADSCGGTLTNSYAINNLMWDLGASGIWSYASSIAYNNTIYDYGKGSDGLGGKEGITSYIGSGSFTATNNIIYSPSGVNPFDSSGGSHTYNLCGSGESCGSSSRTWSANTVLSTNEDNANFLKTGSSSIAKDAGVNVGVTIDYLAAPRPYASGYDIGAFEYIEYSSSDPAPMPPIVHLQ